MVILDEIYDNLDSKYHDSIIAYFDYNGCLPSDDDVADMIKPIKAVFI